MSRILGFLAAAIVLAAQSPDAGQPVLRVTTRLVEVDVVARDHRGLESNLGKDDFSVFDNGKRQTIAVFEKRAGTATSASTPAAGQSSQAGPDSGRSFTNRRDETASYTIVLLDALDTDAMEQRSGKDSVLKYLRQVKPQDQVAIYTLGGTVQLEQDFTGNAALLVKAVERGRWGAGYLRPDTGKKAEAAAIEANARVNAQLSALARQVGTTFLSHNAGESARHIQQVCVRLIALARYLCRFPGRKNLLWMTHAFPLVAWGKEPQLYAEEVSQVNHAFSDAGVAVYPIDTRGLIAPKEVSAAPLPSGVALGAAGMPIPATGASVYDTRPAANSSHISAGIETMDLVARYTGGRAFHDTNDLFTSMRSAAAEAAGAYILGFYPKTSDLDSKRHTLKVEVARPGIELRYRQGYTATVDDPATKMPERAQIAEAVWSSLETGGIHLAAKYERVDQPSPGLLRLTLSIAGSDVTTRPAEGGFFGELALVYDARSAEGRDLGRISEVLNLQYDEEHNRTLSRDGIQYSHLLHPPPATKQIRVVLYDRNSGRLGSLNVPLN